jgi:enterochelin esterase family protein
MSRLTFFLLSFVCALAADKLPPRQLIELANTAPNSLREALITSFPPDDLTKGTAVAAYGPDFLWAVETAAAPLLFVDDAQWPTPMRKVAGEGPVIWYQTGKLRAGTSHSFHYTQGGIAFGGRTDVAAYLPDCYPRPGVPQGTLSEKIVHKSQIYPGMESNYWIYVPADYDSKTPAALMVYQDGQGHINRDGGSRTLNVLDNLIYEKKIPSMIAVFIQPGMVEKKAMRSIEYDTVDDRYARFLRDEILADVEKAYSIRKDAYSRGITGSSSGGICAFNTAWFHNELFSRVISRIGSFTSIQWHPDEIEGGNVYPFKIRKETKRNIRVWLQDGANDLENNHGSWPLQNLQMANSLKMMGYDFHYTLGNGTHNGAQWNAQEPDAMEWMWRDYDASKTAQTFEQEPSEKAKPLYRVSIANRGSGVPAGANYWTPDATEQKTVPQGKLTDKRVHTSKIYDGMKSDYWVYTPAAYDPKTAAALMVWQDGEQNVDRAGQSHTLTVIDNLTYQKRIPVAVHVFISPGTIGDKRMRSVEYDTVNDTYARFLRDEILAEISKEYNIRGDAYSRAIAGESSGGICAFNAAWFHPEMFSRVVSRVGSFTSIQWHPGQVEGGNVYPFKVRKEPKRNIRVWLQDGADDLENEHGSWPLQNLQMANSLKMMGYDFHLSFGPGKHGRIDGQMEAPAELAWIWRDYDPSTTEQTFEMEERERSKPLYRVEVSNRE